MTVLASVSSPANGTVLIHELLTALLAAGCTVKRWSDGTPSLQLSADALSRTTNPYGSAGSGVGNLGNTSAWFRVAMQDGTEFLFQRGAADTAWFISRSLAGFTGTSAGTITAVVTGSATDATPLHGTAASAASNVANTTATIFSATPGRLFLSCEDATPYGFTVALLPLGGGNLRYILAYEPLFTGTTAPEDTDPRVWLAYTWIVDGTGLSATAGFVLTQSSSMIGYKRWPSGSNARFSYGPITESGSSVAPASGSSSGQIGSTPSGAKEVPIRIQVFRSGTASTSTGWIGLTSRHRWGTVGGRANGDKLVDGSNHWLYLAGMWIPWDATTPTLS